MPTLQSLYAEANCLYLWKVLCKQCKYRKNINVNCRFTICFYLIWINFGVCTFHKPCFKIVFCFCFCFFFFFLVCYSKFSLKRQVLRIGWIVHPIGWRWMGLCEVSFKRQSVNSFSLHSSDDTQICSYRARGSEGVSPSLWILWSYWSIICPSFKLFQLRLSTWLIRRDSAANCQPH